MAASCYWPNGDIADNYMPCPNSGACCAVGEACLSNNLCYGAKLNIAYRGACADKSWPMATCPRVCYDEVPVGWANLYACPNNDNQVFTCGASGWASKNCDENLGTYHWDHANVSVAQLGKSASTSASSASTITETVTAAGTGQIETVTATSEPNTVGLGAGLGVGLGVPLLLVSTGLVWFCLRTRRQAAGMQPAAVQSVPMGHAGWTGQEKAAEVEGTTPSRTELPVNME